MPYLLDTSTRTGLTRDARCSLATLDVMVAEKRNVRLQCMAATQRVDEVRSQVNHACEVELYLSLAILARILLMASSKSKELHRQLDVILLVSQTLKLTASDQPHPAPDT